MAYFKQHKTSYWSSLKAEFGMSSAGTKAKIIGGALIVLVSLFGATANVAPILTDEKGTEKALKNINLKPIEVGGGKWFGGSEGDFWRTKFKAVNLNGDTVTGYGTRGLWKGTTLRFDND